MANTAKQKLFELLSDMTGMSTIPMEYGGGLDAAYMSLSDRRSNAFADPNANTAFDSPTSKNGLPIINRFYGGDVYSNEQLAEAEGMTVAELDAGAGQVQQPTGDRSIPDPLASEGSSEPQPSISPFPIGLDPRQSQVIGQVKTEARGMTPQESAAGAGAYDPYSALDQPYFSNPSSTDVQNFISRQQAEEALAKAGYDRDKQEADKPDPNNAVQMYLSKIAQLGREAVSKNDPKAVALSNSTLFEAAEKSGGLQSIANAAAKGEYGKEARGIEPPQDGVAMDTRYTVSKKTGGSLPTIYREAGGGGMGDEAEAAAAYSDYTDAYGSAFDDDESGYYGDSEEFAAPINYSTSGNVDPGLQRGDIGIATSPPSGLTDGGSDLDTGGYGIGLDTLSRLGIVGPDAPPDGGILGNYIDPNQEDDEEAEVGQYRKGTFLDNLVAGTAFGRAVGVGDNPKEKGVFVSDKQLDRNPDYDKDDAKVDQARNNLGNRLTQVAQQARQQAEDKIGDRGMTPMNEKEAKEMSPDKAAKDAVSKAAAGMVDNYKEYADLGSPYGDLGALGFIAPGGTALSGLSALANAARDFFGVVGGGTINGRDVHVHTDGTISFVSPEDEPGYQNTDNDSGNDQLPRRRIAQAPAPVAAPTTATEKPKTGMAALLARRQPVANRLDTLTDLQEKFQKIYNRPFRTV